MKTKEFIVGWRTGQGMSLPLYHQVGRERLTEKQLAHHVHVVGASGFGKTVFLKKLIKHRIESKQGLVFIDLKNDVGLVAELKAFAELCGRKDEVSTFTISGTESDSYNLLKHGDATELRDRIISCFNWSEEYYKNQAMSMLLKVLIGLCCRRDQSGVPFGIREVFECVKDLEALRNLLRCIPKHRKHEESMVREAIVFMEKEDGYKSLQGLRTQFESLIHSGFGRKLHAGQTEIDIYKAALEQKIVLVALDSRRYPEASKTIGRMMISDLKSASSRLEAETREHERKPMTVVIDEFADLATDDFIAFLDRARSSRMSIVVAHQELADLDQVSPGFTRRLMGNMSTFYAFLQKGPESAELISKTAGTRMVEKLTHQTERLWLFNVRSGRGTVRQTEEFIVHPNVVKSLRVGECVVIKKYPKAVAHRVKVKI